ncbi:MAG: fibrobacter succinogenes major paralogous domain-containing protein [Chitinispirillales bacterium]|jgi:uncharacterized protein (TIGR02145 family)|nr:fibrobacter succinogenes major paralogous domain-containing protein [Chitinispirillales bacterium]
MKKRISALTALTVATIVAGCGTGGGSFTDPRDGKTYRTVRIGNLTWMAENLNFEIGESVCYENDESNCQKYGRLYDWETAMEACPAGWRLPSEEDWDSLVLITGGQRAGTKLKSKTGWNYNNRNNISGNGTNDFGFSALPGGIGNSDSFAYAGYLGYWWSATEFFGAGLAWRWRMYYDRKDVPRSLNIKTYLFSLRCVEDSKERKNVAPVVNTTQVIDTTWPPGTQFNPNVIYGSFTDDRNGKIYRTVEVGAQTWMAENLNFEIGDSWCYDNNERNCQRYGRLYSWGSAMTACPAGWRLPSDAEWAVLVNAVGYSSTVSKKLKSMFGWNNLNDGTSGNGTDDYGFSALPGGRRYSGRGSDRPYFNAVSRTGYWWSATEFDGGSARHRTIEYFTDIVSWSHGVKADGFAVRCVTGCADTAEASAVSPVSAPGSFTDPRDGQTYRTVKIGDFTWMAENLNYQAHDSWCYDNDRTNCSKYGRLYTWDAARTACPTGWHLPSRKGWDNLVRAAGGTTKAGERFKSRTGWKDNSNGTDDYGFSALPGGFRHLDGSFDVAGDQGYWWSDAERGSSDAYYRQMSFNYEDIDEYPNDKGHGFSVRCAKD